ncbi:trypsin-like peptidase domain-containing protein [Corynebacterium spheniscorum]|uniref:Trypsin n=1 Tax=Corynebacterium spheniscorum TaxID=185761 RepID=A0A1I2SU37_9CORY|nr:trypsin-like peptidase domain-containing protein [Corynebacterium spheniscorum]KAA8724248.1 trypsin-like peptidase domain-containing protein [Corynebacterium spheniscorum]SFG56108.1 hypothetical protein SAMN05660282_01242 [Corynebacterium spheniscorum]
MTTTVRISEPGGTFCSGVLIAPDLNAYPKARTRLVLSCAHFLRKHPCPFEVQAPGMPKNQLIDVRCQKFGDLAVGLLATPAPPRKLMALSSRRGQLWRTRTCTSGYGGGETQELKHRFGRILWPIPWAFARDFSTHVRGGATLWNNPKVVRGDSGGPVCQGEEIIGVQSLIMDPLGVDLGLATTSQVAPFKQWMHHAIKELYLANEVQDS